MRILIVDDDVTSLTLLENCLQQLGYEVFTASDGVEGLAQYRRCNPRIVISDVEMPGMTGVELCRAIRRHQSMNYTYCILLTGLTESKNIVDGLDAGADDYIAKPFDPKELQLRLEAGKRLLTIEGRDMMIFSLAKLAECRDSDTGQHLDRIREYTKIIATDLAMSKKFEAILDQQYIELLYVTSPLHDIGKVGIPDRILLKPGKLSSDEFQIMKQHTVIGGETLRAAASAHPEASFLKMALDIVLYHHERWDGTGYPEGLAGEAIPLCARIVAVADVYDALTSARVYKAAFSHSEAYKIIVEGSGKHFDPDVVAAFISSEHQMDEIRAGLQELNIAPVPPMTSYSAVAVG